MTMSASSMQSFRPLERVMLVTIGTRGDVQPYVALARELIRSGIQTAVATYAAFQSMVERCGAVFTPLKGDPSAILSNPEMRDAVWQGKLIDQMRASRETIKDLPDNYRATYEAVKRFRPDLLLATITTLSECLAIGQAMSLPVITLATVPIMPSKEYAPVTVMSTPIRVGAANYAAHLAVAKATGLLLKEAVNAFREEIGAPPAESFSFTATPVLHVYSPEVFPQPSDWPEYGETVGYLYDAADAPSPDPALVEFLGSGPAPVYVGLGSMMVPDFTVFCREVIAGVGQLGMRAIICGGANALHDVALPPTVLYVREAPHEWLFPRCAAVVHHGGAGTTGAALRAGVPSVVFPVLADQPFWAARVAALGAGPAQFLPARQLNATTLVTQLRAVLCEPVRAAARALGSKLRAERGVQRAVAAIRRHHAFLAAVLERSPRLRWEADSSTGVCRACAVQFGLFTRRHHCRVCGGVYCGTCAKPHPFPNYAADSPPLVCPKCRTAVSAAATAASAAVAPVAAATTPITAGADAGSGAA